MIVRSWGSRGSMPVSGKKYLKYGGDTTCIEIRTASDDIIIIDAGTGIRRLGKALLAEGRRKFHFLFTHVHWDHLMGFPFFEPLFSAETEVHLYRCPFTDCFIERSLSVLMGPPHFPVNYKDLEAQIVTQEACPNLFEIGSVVIEPIPISHPNAGSGYKFSENGKTFVFLTDNELNFTHPLGLPFEAYLEFSAGADLLIHDAEYTPEEYQTTRSWGHTVYTEALRLALEAGVRRLGLFHLNRERTDEGMDRIVERCRQKIDTGKQKLDCLGVTCNMSFDLRIDKS